MNQGYFFLDTSFFFSNADKAVDHLSNGVSSYLKPPNHMIVLDCFHFIFPCANILTYAIPILEHLFRKPSFPRLAFTKLTKFFCAAWSHAISRLTNNGDLWNSSCSAISIPSLGWFMKAKCSPGFPVFRLAKN